MIRRKDTRILDLEFMMPKHMKEERVYVTGSEFQEDLREEPFHESPRSGLHETCCMCGRSSDESVLVPAFYCGRDQWICPNCLHSSGRSSESNPSPLFDDPTSSDSSSNPMGMFDRI